MQHGLVILCLLFPSSREPAKAIHPAVHSLDNPTIVFELRVFTGIRLFFAGLDIRLVAAAQYICFQLACFVTIVQTESGFLSRIPRMKGIERIRNQLDVVRIRCSDDQRQR